jgi:hypothetical protein
MTTHYMDIQGVPGGNVNILGGQGINHSKQKSIYTYVLFWTVSEIELFHCTVARLLIKRYYVLYLIPVFIVFKWQNWYSLPRTIHFRKFRRQYQSTLPLVWGHGVLLICSLTFLYAGDYIHYENGHFVSCIHLQPPNDASHWFTCFIQWRSTAGVKDNIGRQIQTPVQWNSSISETVRNRTHVHIHFFA